MLAFMLAATLSFGIIPGDSTMSCCTLPKDGGLSFASDPAFVASHIEPVAHALPLDGGSMVTFPVSGGPAANGYLVKSPTASNRWIFVFHEWWGLNDHIKGQAEALQKELGNVNVLALDMYDGSVTDKREAAAAQMQAFKQERADAIVKAAMAYTGPDASIGTLGWCFGGGQSMAAALTLGRQAQACVVYYGMAPVDSSKLTSLNCSMLGIFGLKDQWPSPAMVNTLKLDMSKAGKSLTVYNYDAGHAFANPSNPGHNKEFTADAWKHTIDFLRIQLLSPRKK